MGVPVVVAAQDDDDGGGNLDLCSEKDKECVRAHLLQLVAAIHDVPALIALTHLARPFALGQGVGDTIGGLLAFPLYYYTVTL